MMSPVKYSGALKVPGKLPALHRTDTNRATAFKLFFLALCFLPGVLSVSAQIHLTYEQNRTLPYGEVIAAYQYLAKTYDNACLIEYGLTDIGKPLHLFVISRNGEFDPAKIRAKGKRIILILNGIHPGESAGVDASIRFADELLRNENYLAGMLENTVVCIIPVYNIGGALNKSPYYRTNQVGPDDPGFRGNARNLDLNRDFIKMDSKNARSFAEIFRQWQPDVFLDTHTTNGSDHQYTITLIATSPSRLQVTLAGFEDGVFVPGLYRLMAATPYEMTPYVFYMNQSPENGISAFYDTPRFSTGYVSLFNSIGFIMELHAYKEFPDRVRAAYHFMVSLLRMTHDQAEAMGRVRKEAVEETERQEVFYLNWRHDTVHFEPVTFKGYGQKAVNGPLTGTEYRVYNHSQPYTMQIPYYKYFIPEDSVEKPFAYLIPQAWDEVIKRLELNGIALERLKRDTLIRVDAYYITDINTAGRPYNGHYGHSDIQVRKEYQEISFCMGDVLVRTDQPGNRYIVETLEPGAPDSFLSWNFFDPILERREYFSPVHFEEKAAKILESDPQLKADYERKLSEDPDFARNSRARLQFIYERSPYAEKSYRRYPVYRVEE